MRLTVPILYAFIAANSLISASPRPAAATYDPKHGRWLQREPLLGIDGTEPLLQYSDGFSLSQYVRSNPAAKVDPRGQASATPVERGIGPPGEGMFPGDYLGQQAQVTQCGINLALLINGDPEVKRLLLVLKKCPVPPIYCYPCLMCSTIGGFNKLDKFGEVTEVGLCQPFDYETMRETLYHELRHSCYQCKRRNRGKPFPMDCMRRACMEVQATHGECLGAVDLDRCLRQNALKNMGNDERGWPDCGTRQAAQSAVEWAMTVPNCNDPNHECEKGGQQSPTRGSSLP